MQLEGKKVILGITASIAAYKAQFLVRLLTKAGAEVRVIITPASKEFVTTTTLATLAKHPVYSEYITDPETGEWTNHVDLGGWADLMLIAPLTANSLAKMAHGYCDNLLLAVYLSAKCPVMVAPAMDLDMYAHSTTHDNLKQLERSGVEILEARHGELASGLVGKGRLAEPEEILEAVLHHFNVRAQLTGKTVLVTAGPTYEPIDPVRFIGNHSSGKMGYEIAKEALYRGAQVILISGPTSLSIEHPNLVLTRVTTAAEMNTAVGAHLAQYDIAILAAAVADYRPQDVADQKIKKADSSLELRLEKTTDILAGLGQQKRAHQVLVGFALETENEQENAQKKLAAKNLDFIVLNSLRDKGAGFGVDTNKVSIISKSGDQTQTALSSKAAIASIILDTINTKLD